MSRPGGAPRPDPRPYGSPAPSPSPKPITDDGTGKPVKPVKR